VKGEHFGHLKGDYIEGRYDEVFGRQPRYIDAAGCKVFYYHPHEGDPATLFSLLKSNPRLKVIHLKRGNKLRCVLSWMIAQKSQVYVANDDASLMSGEEKRLHVDLEELLFWIEKTKAWERWGDDTFSDRDVLQIRYEDMVSDRSAQYRRVLKYLKLPNHEPQSPLIRQNPEAVDQLILNWTEIRQGLIENGYERFLPRNN
jgi:LPS sulfotransferase NodH